MSKGTFKNKFSFKIRKMLISLKRNYYVIPLFMVVVCCVQFLCSLYVLSPMFARVNGVLGSYNSIFIFVVSLFGILSCITYMNYALKKADKKRPIAMLILYLVMWVVIVVLVILLVRDNHTNLLEEISDLSNTTDESQQIIYQKYINLGKQSEGMLIAQIVLDVITIILVITAPLVQKAFKKLTFKSLDTYEEQK